VEREHVDVVPPPCQSSSVRSKDQACEVVDGTGWPVLAGNPFGIDECQRTGLDRDGKTRVNDLARGIGQIDGNFDCVISLRHKRSCKQQRDEKGVVEQLL